ncbi:penicillin acylase family protein, partial [Candidatus Hydrogenedentota bacterium]
MLRRHCVIISLLLAVSGICYLGSAEAAEHEAKIIRDTWGIPHILSSTDEGAMFGLGYACAEDRMFQMEFSRRAIQGRLAELVGNLEGNNGRTVLKGDKKSRTTQFYPHAQTVAENLKPESKRMLQAYADGVNQYLEDNADNLHHLFEDNGLTPEPWTMADSISCWVRVTQFFGPGWSAGDNQTLHNYEDLIAGGKTPEEARAQMYPPLPVDESAAVVTEADFDVCEPGLQEEIERYLAAHGYGPDIVTARKTGVSYSESVPHFSHGWVVGGARTTNGTAVLHSDPQTTVRNPAIWHEAHVEGETFNSRGISFPGCPGFIIGFNENV